MGTLDRGARLAISAALLLLAFATGALGGGVAFLLALAVSGVFTVTALVGTCPLYSIVGFKTCKAC